MLKQFSSLAGAVALALASLPALAADPKLDLKQAVPADVFLAVYGKDNPEREYLREYGQEIWNTIREEKIGRRIVDLIGSRIPEDKKQEAKDAWQEFKDAVEPVNLESLENVKEVVFAERMEAPFTHYLLLMRIPDDGAKGLKQAVANVFELVAEKHEEDLDVAESEQSGVDVTSLEIGGDCPMTPAVAQVEDVFVFCTSPELLEQTLQQLTGGSGESKFDDPRLKSALERLPEPEDSLVFFDGRQFFESLQEIPEFIRQQKGDDDEAERVARIINLVIEHVAILDYEVVVEYTEEGQNRQSAIGQLVDDLDQKVLGQALINQQPFEDWQSWIPADATSYTLCTGADPHVLYQGLMDLIHSEIPEAEEGLEKFERFQDEIGVDFDRDILQNVSGEFISVTIPVGEGSAAKPHTVVALKVEQTDDVRALIARGVEALQQIPAVKAQSVALVDDEDLEGFREIKANIFAAVGVRPVFGFHDDWLVISSHRDAVKKVAKVLDGEAESIASADALEKFGIEVGDKVYLASYTDVGEGVRKAADFVEQIGTWAMVFGGAALANAPEEDAETVREALGLLPSIAKVIRKFDFYEDRLSITQEGPEENTYRRDKVTNIRQPEERDQNAEAEGEAA